jgi:hypothetical protein
MPQPQVRSPIHRRGPTWVPARSPAIPNLASQVSTSAASPCLRWRAQHKQEKAAACSLHERKEKPSEGGFEPPVMFFFGVVYKAPAFPVLAVDPI